MLMTLPSDCESGKKPDLSPVRALTRSACSINTALSPATEFMLDPGIVFETMHEILYLLT